MCTCEFCRTQFIPRPQVKKPRACKSCQGKRQRQNESDWRKKNAHLQDQKYHQVRRSQRYKKLAKLAFYLAHCMSTGLQMVNLGQSYPKIEALVNWILPLLLKRGIRLVNKFWHENRDCFYSDLESYLAPLNLQTSSSTS